MAHMFLAIVTDTNAHVLLRFVFPSVGRLLFFFSDGLWITRGPDFESVLLLLPSLADHEIGNSHLSARLSSTGTAFLVWVDRHQYCQALVYFPIHYEVSKGKKEKERER